jgi:hypothetical protein
MLFESDNHLSSRPPHILNTTTNTAWYGFSMLFKIRFFSVLPSFPFLLLLLRYSTCIQPCSCSSLSFFLILSDLLSHLHSIFLSSRWYLKLTKIVIDLKNKLYLGSFRVGCSRTRFRGNRWWRRARVGVIREWEPEVLIHVIPLTVNVNQNNSTPERA